MPLIFEESILTTQSIENKPLVKHLYIFVHGFQGCSLDMEIFKTYLLLYNPNSCFLFSKSNETNTNKDIGEMGKKLAEEVKEYIDHHFAKLEKLGRISFLAHSLGGLIARAALPLLEEYKKKMCSFVSLSSPHFGYMFSDSKVICAGLWVLKKWYGAQSLEQLSFSDQTELTDCFLYKLAKADVILQMHCRELTGSRM